LQFKLSHISYFHLCIHMLVPYELVSTGCISVYSEFNFAHFPYFYVKIAYSINRDLKLIFQNGN